VVRALRGRPRKYCSHSCRQRAYERRRVDETAAAIGTWLEHTRDQLEIARAEVDDFERLLHPSQWPEPRRRRAAPRVACPEFGRLALTPTRSVEDRARPLVGPRLRFSGRVNQRGRRNETPPQDWDAMVRRQNERVEIIRASLRQKAEHDAGGKVRSPHT